MIRIYEVLHLELIFRVGLDKDNYSFQGFLSIEFSDHQYLDSHYYQIIKKREQLNEIFKNTNDVSSPVFLTKMFSSGFC